MSDGETIYKNPWESWTVEVVYWYIRVPKRYATWHTFQLVSEYDPEMLVGDARWEWENTLLFRTFEEARAFIVEESQKKCKVEVDVVDLSKLGLHRIPEIALRKCSTNQPEFECMPCAARPQENGLADISYKLSINGEPIDFMALETGPLKLLQ